jgi:leucine efflux protein
MSRFDWIGFFSASAAVILSPGPGSLYVLNTAALSGTRAARLAMVGILAGDLILVSLSFLGNTLLLSSYPPFLRVLRIAGAGFLSFLGLQLLISSPEEDKQPKDRKKRGFFEKGVAITLSNPSAIFFFMVFFSLFLIPGEQGRSGFYLLLILLFLGMNQLYLFFLILTVAKIGRSFSERRWFRLGVRRFCGILFLFFAAKGFF